MDRILGLIALVFVAALGATAIGRLHHAAAPIWPVWLWAGFLAGAAATTPAVFAPVGFGRLLRPLTVFHPEWVGGRIETLTGALAKFGADPGALVRRLHAARSSFRARWSLFYFAVSYALHLDITFWDLAVVVPMSFVVQLLPVSVGGFGVREAFFSYYFHRIGQPIEDAVLLSLVAQALLILFSLVRPRRVRLAPAAPLAGVVRDHPRISGIETGETLQPAFRMSPTSGAAANPRYGGNPTIS